MVKLHGQCNAPGDSTRRGVIGVTLKCRGGVNDEARNGLSHIL